jgi:hypothetical protein
MLGCGSAGLAGLAAPVAVQIALLGAASAAYLALIAAISRAWSRRAAAPGHEAVP